MLKPRLTQYVTHSPTPTQTAFLLLDCKEAFFGGAAGGGKSDALLMAALQYVDVPGYAGIIFRRTYADLSLPGALIPRSHEWLGGTDASWDGSNHLWRFPSGARLAFGYLQYTGDEQRYRSAEFQFLGFDELTAFPERPYRYLHSRLRRPSGGALSGVPLRIRAASNPGGIGHEWVQERFLTNPGPRIFIPSYLSDNPHLDVEAYRETLSGLDDVTAAQLLYGDWNVRPSGGRFDRRWVTEWHDDFPPGAEEWLWCRYFDLAATKEKPGTDPDYTAGALLGINPETRGVWVADVARMRGDPGEVEDWVKAVSLSDRMRLPNLMVRMEKEPGSAGETVVSHYTKVLSGYSFDGIRSTGKKEVRALPFGTAMKRGLVHFVRGPWANDFFNEAEAFPLGAHDDQVDAASGAFNALTDTLFEPASQSIERQTLSRPSTPGSLNPYHRQRVERMRRLSGG